MTAPIPENEAREMFAHCVQVLGGVTASSRRLEIDERAIRRFVSGERPLNAGILTDTAKALRRLTAEAAVAEADLAALIGAQTPPEAH
ncbi:hypothetical protein [Novosphingobium sp. Chol11]|uniref:hypothetical protein n=1 Tax=Novosphingobium sp. Chol11 TaxID=1385763 RepID=UPI0025D7321F|nr:hypothetical protein [Novosphingobium sp. Chol11]